MTDPAGIADWLDNPVIDEARDERERRDAAKILDLARRLAARRAPVLPTEARTASASLHALSTGATVAHQLSAQPETLVVAEIAAAVLAAPSLATEPARESALVRGLGIADRLLPRGELDPGRDTGTWGCIAGAVAVAAVRTPDEIAEIGSIAASLALAPVRVARSDVGYCALRVGHAAASALIAVSLADSGFVGDVQAIDELRLRLGVDQEPAYDHERDPIVGVGMRAMQEAIR